ncbi:carbonic anhydrase [Arthrobacter sp.]|uniref:carbonic anhydrase n=1 Tax=Arthrobacter sp. TaxID=1667 RepID=UPI00289EAF5A|nr:carbonic anhydrase [Arthrobacter sp.]
MTEINSPLSAPVTPAEAWQRLREGNDRFIAGSSQHPNQDAPRRSSLVNQQNPFAVIFGCSDSRLAAEIIFDLGLGDAFVVRTAGQVTDDAVLGSLEYSVGVLGVPLIVVLGHDSCGAVTATKESVDTGSMPAGHVRTLVERITPSVLAAKRNGLSEVNDMVVEHTRQTAERLVEDSRLISDAVASGRAAVVGLSYHLAAGRADLVSSIGNLTTGVEDLAAG